MGGILTECCFILKSETGNGAHKKRTCLTWTVLTELLLREASQQDE